MLPMPALVGGSACYLTGEDALRLTVLNGSSSIVVTVSGRFLPIPVSNDAPPPRIVPFTFSISPSTARSPVSVTNALGEGWLLDCAVRATTGPTNIGQTYAIVSIVRGVSTVGEDLSTLTAGYVTTVQRISWPWMPIVGCLEGAGALRTITGTSPGAGAEILETVPTRAHWELLSFRYQLVTSVAVASRSLSLQIDDGAAQHSRSAWDTIVAASTTIVVHYSQGFGKPWNDQSGGAYAQLPINNRLGSAHRIQTVTANIQAADQYSAVRYLVREWIEGS